MTKRLLGAYVILALIAAVAVPRAALADDCQTMAGEPRECTISELLDKCLLAAVDAADQRAEKGEGSVFLRAMWLTADSVACGLKFITPFV